MIKENKDKDLPKTVRRFAPATMRFEKREESGQKFDVITGIAAVVGSRTSLGWFDEIIEKGAFDDALADPDLDCRCLKNHNPNLLLARYRANSDKNTLELFLTDSGDLGFRYTTPDRTHALDLQDEIRKGDIDQCSFQFTIEEESWKWEDEGSGEKDLRTIKKIGVLYDVGPVTYPAYRDTGVMIEEAKRTFEAAKAEGLRKEQERKREAAKPLKRKLYKPLIDSL